MFALCATVLLCFLSVSQSAPLSCEDLVRPMDQLQPHHLDGRWAVVAGSLSDLLSLNALKDRDSITIYINSSETSTLSYTQINRFGEGCQYGRGPPYNISMEGSSFTFDVGGRFNLTGTFLYTSCPDCLMMHWDVESSRRVSMELYLISRRREVELKEMEEYKAQLKCLALPPPVMMDPTKELCPEHNLNEPEAAQAEKKAEEPKA